MGYRIINGKAHPIGNFQTLPIEQRNQQNTTAQCKESFKSILDKALESNDGYKLSKHAAERLKEINFTDQDMTAIGKGFDIAEGKNSKNSVILYKDVALIASIENKTVITAVERDRAKENIFTNIDSVVIL